MSKKMQYSWDNNVNVLDDVDFDLGDAELFQQLLNPADMENSNLSVAAGKILQGSIVGITKDFAVIDVGLKSEGLVPLSEFADRHDLKIGQVIDVYLDNPEDTSGQIVLSKEKADRQKQWEFILNNCVEGSIVTGKVIRKVKGGLMVDIGVEAFLPGSQIDNKRIKNIDEYLNEAFEFKILKINVDRKNIVLSRRELLEAERISKKAEMLEMIQSGELRMGVVKNITDFGVFLDLNGIDGLLHITDMTWKRIKHPSEMVAVGQELEVMILGVDKDKGRVALGLKQKEANPWQQISEKYPPGTRVVGKIVNLVQYGAFIEIEPGIEGLIHSSEMSWVKNVTDPSEIVHKGQEVEAIVKEVQVNEGKISLSIKQTEENPWDEVEAKYPVETVVEVEVRNLTNYGAFVEIEPGIDGLIHISDLSWVKKISHPSEVLKKGDKLMAMILSIDKESKKITLGVKQLQENPWEKIKESLPIGCHVKGTVIRTTAFGAFVEIDHGIEAIIPAGEITDQPLGKIEDFINKGDEVEAKVTRVEPEHKKVYLSVKELKMDYNQTNRDDIVIS